VNTSGKGIRKMRHAPSNFFRMYEGNPLQKDKNNKRTRTILHNLMKSPIYDICCAFAMLDYSNNYKLEEFALECMFSFRKMCSKEYPITELKTRRGKDLYYQFRQAKTFDELARAFERANPDYNISIFIEDLINSNQDRKISPDMDIDRAELCSVQEHFENILREILSSIDIDKDMIKEIDTLLVEDQMRKRDDVRNAVANALRASISPADIGRTALWTVKLYTANKTPTLDVKETLEILALPGTGDLPKNSESSEARVTPQSPSGSQIKERIGTEATDMKQVKEKGKERVIEDNKITEEKLENRAEINNDEDSDISDPEQPFEEPSNNDEDSDKSESDPEQPFDEWFQTNIDLAAFPDPSTFLNLEQLDIKTSQDFIEWWKKGHPGQIITGFQSFTLHGK